MDARDDIERLVTIPEGQRRYCTVCKTFAHSGAFFQYKNDKHIGRHVGCTPKNAYSPSSESTVEKPLAASMKRRRAGGHGYTGGDGWVDL